MATDVDVQYFSHLNGLILGNNWGDLIRLLDKALVTGVDFTQITAASIDAQGDVHITLYAAHNAMLFQVVELSGFTPASLNQKYRIKGVPSATELILKPHAAIVETNITTVGAGKLASLGYEIIFRDTNDVKRVYRAKNPTAQHPFIRVDESLTSPDGTTGVYTSTYAKYAMVGLLEHMEHIDDYEKPGVLQLPFDPADPAKNWKITGTSTGCVRGWSRWYWARRGSISANSGDQVDSLSPSNGSRDFLIVGNSDYFLGLKGHISADTSPYLFGCGLYDSSLDNSLVPNWFLMSTLTQNAANAGILFNAGTISGSIPLLTNLVSSSNFFVCNYNLLSKLSQHEAARGILPNNESGFSGLYTANDVNALQIPILSNSKRLLGTLPSICYMGEVNTKTVLTPVLSGNSMYLAHPAYVAVSGNTRSGGVYFYIGELS
ncbi:hypothetical protein [Acinetobacter variabilis]|uniref:hypothetical protein n=1 Tax=Acinetobacter variabilis TaxID=70346 RepID=UPI00254F318F|nr:hypothetical protein [Acinetobacter variabilis]